LSARAGNVWRGRFIRLCSFSDLALPLIQLQRGIYTFFCNYVERGPIDIKSATEQSDNPVYIQLAQDLELENVANAANKLSTGSTLDIYPSMAIGGLGEGATPVEMASSYSTLANRGTRMEPYLVDEVTR
jgi:membrane peptidoglycan carboxypeptidase